MTPSHAPRSVSSLVLLLVVPFLNLLMPAASCKNGHFTALENAWPAALLNSWTLSFLSSCRYCADPIEDERENSHELDGELVVLGAGFGDQGGLGGGVGRWLAGESPNDFSSAVNPKTGVEME